MFRVQRLTFGSKGMVTKVYSADIILKHFLSTVIFRSNCSKEEPLLEREDSPVKEENISTLQNTREYNKWLELFNIHNPLYSGPKSDDFSSFNGIKKIVDLSGCF